MYILTLDLRRKINELTKLKAASEKFGIPEVVKAYNKQIDKYQKDIVGIENKVTSAQQMLTKVWEKYPDNEVVRISQEVVSSKFEFDLLTNINLLKMRIKY